MSKREWLRKKDPGYEAFVEELRQIVSDGYTMMQVAEMFSTAKKAVTKGAVAGCTHRNGITFGIKNSEKGGSTKDPAHSKKSVGAVLKTPSRKSQSNILVYKPLPILLPTVETNRCQWPIGNPGEKGFRWCSKDKEKGPYCMEHWKDAHAPTPMNKMDIHFSSS